MISEQHKIQVPLQYRKYTQLNSVKKSTGIISNVAGNNLNRFKNEIPPIININNTNYNKINDNITSVINIQNNYTSNNKEVVVVKKNSLASNNEKQLLHLNGNLHNSTNCIRASKSSYTNKKTVLINNRKKFTAKTKKNENWDNSTLSNLDLETTLASNATYRKDCNNNNGGAIDITRIPPLSSHRISNNLLYDTFLVNPNNKSRTILQPQPFLLPVYPNTQQVPKPMDWVDFNYANVNPNVNVDNFYQPNIYSMAQNQNVGPITNQPSMRQNNFNETAQSMRPTNATMAQNQNFWPTMHPTNANLREQTFNDTVQPIFTNNSNRIRAMRPNNTNESIPLRSVKTFETALPMHPNDLESVLLTRPIDANEVTSMCTKFFNDTVPAMYQKNANEIRSIRAQTFETVPPMHPKNAKDTVPTVHKTNANKVTFKLPKTFKTDLPMHPDNMNELILNSRYRLLKILGKGSFGKVFRSFDIVEKRFVALKIIMSDNSASINQSLIEKSILRELNMYDDSKNHVVCLLDDFMWNNHRCLVFELLNMNLYELLQVTRGKGLDLDTIRTIASKLLLSLTLLHDHNVIHCDLKPENIMVSSDCDGLVKLVDFGSSCKVGSQIYSYIQSRFYRAPEVMLELNYSKPIDIWSLGCLLAEMSTCEPLFCGRNELDQMAHIIHYFGYPPNDMIRRSNKAHKFFTYDAINASYKFVSCENNSITFLGPFTKSLKNYLLRNKNTAIFYPCYNSGTTSPFPNGLLYGGIDGIDDSFENFVFSMLNYNPDLRASPYDLMFHPFIFSLLSNQLNIPTDFKCINATTFRRVVQDYRSDKNKQRSLNNTINWPPHIVNNSSSSITCDGGAAAAGSGCGVDGGDIGMMGFQQAPLSNTLGGNVQPTTTSSWMVNVPTNQTQISLNHTTDNNIPPQPPLHDNSFYNTYPLAAPNNGCYYFNNTIPPPPSNNNLPSKDNTTTYLPADLCGGVFNPLLLMNSNTASIVTPPTSIKPSQSLPFHHHNNNNNNTSQTTINRPCNHGGGGGGHHHVSNFITSDASNFITSDASNFITSDASNFITSDASNTTIRVNHSINTMPFYPNHLSNNVYNDTTTTIPNGKELQQKHFGINPDTNYMQYNNCLANINIPTAYYDAEKANKITYWVPAGARMNPIQVAANNIYYK